MARTVATRENFHAYANEHIVPDMFSGVFKFTSLAPILGLRGATDGKLGRPGSRLFVGRKLSPAKKSVYEGSTQAHFFFNTGKVGGGKWIGEDDTGSTAGAERSNKKKKSVYVSWSEHSQPIAIQNQVIDANQGGEAIGNVLEDAVALAVEEQLEELATKIYTGNPSNQSTDEIWSEPIGLQQWIHDSNNVGGIDRSSAANAEFRGRRSTASLKASLSLIDEIMLEGVDDGDSGTTIPLQERGSRGDVILTTNKIYNTLKQEALSRNVGNRVTNAMPEGGQVGFLQEYIDYNGRIISYDPYCPANHLFVLDSNSILMQVFSGKNFSVLPFVDLRRSRPGSGQPDLTTSEVCTKMRLMVHEPWKNFQGTSVQA